MADRKFDIFEVIKEIEGTQIGFFDGLKDYEVKQISPYILMKWMSGVKDSGQLIALNDNVNQWVFSFYRHPKLVYKLLMSSATRKDKRVSWIKRPKNEKQTASIDVIKRYYECSTSDAKDYVKVLTPDELMEMAESLGFDKESTNKLKKEVNGK